MCVICYKKASQKMPTEDKIRSMWDHNHDGAGIMWNYDGKPGFAKGFMKVDDLLEYIKDNEEAFADIEVALHFRIGTHGGNTSGNTHPFVIGDKNTGNQCETCITGGLVLMHNGVLPIKPRRKTISDTAELALRAGTYADPLRYLSDINEFLRGNRIVVFDGKSAHFYGDEWKKGDDGLLYSNLNHELMARSWECLDKWDYDTGYRYGGWASTWTPKPAKASTSVTIPAYKPPLFLGSLTGEETRIAQIVEEDVAEALGINFNSLTETERENFRRSYQSDIESLFYQDAYDASNEPAVPAM